jgi:hypothetical protein
MKAKIVVLLIIMMLTACKYPVAVDEQGAATASVWIDQPLDGSTLMLGHNVFKVSISIPKSAPSKVDLYLNGALIANITTWNHYINQSAGFDYYAFYHVWQAEVPGTFLLEARSNDAVAYANFSVEGPAEEGPEEVVPPRSTETPTATAEPITTEEPSPTPTLEDTSCTVTALVNLFCRPSPGFEPIDSFVPEQSADAVGITGDGFYLLVIGPNNGRECTVPNDVTLVELAGGGCSSLPPFNLLPTPTATATPTPNPTETPKPPQCSDGVDNDGDGQVDLRDRECRDANDDDESTR